MRNDGHRIGSWAIAVALSAALPAIVVSCSGDPASSTATSALASAVASTATSSGTLLCAPTQAQLDACGGKASGDACSISTADGGTTVAGTCRPTVDGASVACVPNPPLPPQALIDACSGKAASDSCTATEPDGDVIQGICSAVAGATTLACFRAPPQAAIDACSGKSAGDACSLTGSSDAGTQTGTCNLRPDGTGPLACDRPHGLPADVSAACSGKTAGATCTLGYGRENESGSCTASADGGAVLCVVPCDALGASFACGRDGDGDHRGGPPGRR